MSDAALLVGMDVDGVLCNLIPSFAEWFSKKKDWPATRQLPVERYDFWRDWGLTEDEFQEGWADATRRGLYRTVDPYEGAIEMVDTLLRAGHEVHLVTDRCPPGARWAAAEDTFTWLGAHSIPAHSVTFTSDKTAVVADLFLDDNPDCYRSIEVVGECVPILWDSPCNQGMRSARRVSTYDQWLSLIELVAVAVDEAGLGPEDLLERQIKVADAVNFWFTGFDFAR